MPIHYAKDGHVVTITIDRPEARNSLDLEHFGQLADCWVRYRDDDDPEVALATETLVAELVAARWWT